tara:strand:- start:5265 stop:6443 length:1179 start_codon:yes stop_codon:yes gene_type:complete
MSNQIKNKFNSIRSVLIRVDFNVPIINNKISDFSRVEAVIPTIRFFLKLNKKVVLISHLGRPKSFDKKFSLQKIIKPLSKMLGKQVEFKKKWLTDTNFNKNSLAEVSLLENLRFHSEETSNEKEFAKIISRYGDIYVNDAFAVSHRHHASVSAILEFFKDKYMGFLLKKELSHLQSLTKIKKRPFTLIVGGSKIGTKIHILKSFLGIADNILIGGGMSFPFIKNKGGDIGQSICIDDELTIVSDFLKTAKDFNTKIILPTDTFAVEKIDKVDSIKLLDICKVPKNFMGVDIGKESINKFKEIILSSNSILWNGPMGIAEISEYSNGTRKVAQYISQATENNTYTMIGGGDTVSDISRFGLKDKFSYVSTGGGAMLEFFKKNKLETTSELKDL